MNSLHTPRSIGPASSQFYRFCAKALQTTTRRHQSSYRRNRSRLNIKPDASFLPTKTEMHDHILFNPPPSMPNVYHTPSLFLPRNDRRRGLQKPDSSSNSTRTTSDPTQLAPLMRKHHEKKYHLTESDAEEMRRLKREDPSKWTSNQLAKKFNCARIFVSMATEGLGTEQKQQQKIVTEVVKSRWGTKRRVAREDRQLRKEKWFRDE